LSIREISENQKVVVLLLPGMDGTGILFKKFVRLLPDGVDAKVVSYPEDKYLTYEQLAERVICVLPVNEPYVIVAESYSGPVAALLAARPVGNLQAVVFVSSFVSLPCGRMGPWIAKVLPLALFRPRAPAWILRRLLMNSATGRELISEVQDAIARVSPEVLARRLRDVLNADFVKALKACTVRIVCLLPESDRLLGTRGLRGFLAAKPDIETVRIAGAHFLLQCAPDSSLAALQKLGLFGSPMPARRT
jgi:pimeloyl-ACP methyl ester carboxylesterase